MLAQQMKKAVTTELDLISIDCKKNKLLQKILDVINSSEEIRTLWKITNVTAINRLRLTDHGILHFNIVANNSLLIARLFADKKIQFSITNDYDLSTDHAEVVILLAALLHDLGMSIHRNEHEAYSLFLVNTLLREILSFMPIAERTIVTSEVLHAIISHRSDGKPLTIEAGIVRVADALDMSGGRTRLPYDESKLDIHSVSALAIDEVTIQKGKKTPVEVEIVMNHTAGIFQVDELLKKKVNNSGIEELLDVKVFIDKGTGKQLFKDFSKKHL
jgi:metal-dependent HD superfamily phosphatase/phosphodiesterase